MEQINIEEFLIQGKAKVFLDDKNCCTTLIAHIPRDLSNENICWLNHELKIMSAEYDFKKEESEALLYLRKVYNKYGKEFKGIQL